MIDTLPYYNAIRVHYDCVHVCVLHDQMCRHVFGTCTTCTIHVYTCACSVLVMRVIVYLF